MRQAALVSFTHHQIPDGADAFPHAIEPALEFDSDLTIDALELFLLVQLVPIDRPLSGGTAS